jgi:hypothetical protein
VRGDVEAILRQLRQGVGEEPPVGDAERRLPVVGERAVVDTSSGVEPSGGRPPPPWTDAPATVLVVSMGGIDGRLIRRERAYSGDLRAAICAALFGCPRPAALDICRLNNPTRAVCAADCCAIAIRARSPFSFVV